MRLKGYFVRVFLCAAIASLLLIGNQPGALRSRATQLHGHSSPDFLGVRPAQSVDLGARPRTQCVAGTNCASFLSLPMAMEANQGQAAPRVAFIGRGKSSTALLTREGIEVILEPPSMGTASHSVKIGFERGTLKAELIVAADSNESAPQDASTRPTKSSTSESKPRARRRSGNSGARGTHRHRQARKRSVRPRTRRRHAAGDRAPGEKQVPHQKAPETPTTPRENNPPSADAGNLQWRGQEKLAGETNYFVGNDPAKWRTHVAHFSRAMARRALPGVDVVAYGNENALEYDLRVSPETDARSLRLRISGADVMAVDASGNLVILAAGQKLLMQKPAMYEELTREKSGPRDSSDLTHERRAVAGGYVIESDGTVGFHIESQEASARFDLANFAKHGASGAVKAGTLVIDPTLSVQYSTFLGGAGDDIATSVAVDSTGKVYVSGTTTSTASFAEPSTKLGPGGGDSDYFVAKIDPTKSGANSLVYLTFIGGSGDEEGARLAVDASGNAAIVGTTTSTDFPVTDGSTRTAGTNDATVTKISATGAQLVFSTLFGGSGAEATQGPGGIAMDSSGNIFAAMDTSSIDITTTAGAFQTTYGGGVSDGFLAIFQPTITPSLKYCTYLGIDAEATIASVAVDASGDAFLAGFTTNPGTSMNTANGFQTTYGGDPSDGFVMKLTPAGNGAADLSYATFLGGGGADKALSISVGTNLPATAYVTGSTQSSNFPTNGSVAALQTNLKGTANSFLSVIVQNAITGVTSLAYSSYLGGSETDTGQSVSFLALNQIYVAGTTTSWNFPWQDNLQPYNGDSDAFVALLDPTSPAGASLIYSTPLGGTAPVGLTAGSQGNAVAVDTSGNVYVAGTTTTADFPRTATPGNGFQLLCASCQLSIPQNDAFVVGIASSTPANPSVSFNAANLNFGSQPVGMPNNAQLPVAIINTGDAPLSISFIGITGPNSVDFSAVNTAACLTSAINPGASCSFEMQFVPSVVGIEGAALSVTDGAPGSPQVLALFGTGAGPLAVPSPGSVNFGNVPAGTSSPSQEITLMNTGNQPLQITEFNFSGSVAQFSLGQNTCTAPNMIAAGASCVMQVSFVPSTTGAFNASLNVTDNSGNVAGAVQSIPMSGVGTTPAPLVVISPTALGFAAQSVGTTSALQSATLTNQGSAALNISGIAVTGVDAGSFGIIQAGSNPCPASGVLAAGANCTVSINFSPTSAGTKNGSLILSDNASGSPQMVSLMGTGVAPSITLSAASLNFAPQGAGTTSAAQTETVSNTGNVPVGIAGIAVTGANSADFIQTNNCPPSLGANSSCHIMVEFDPSASGPASRAASLSISDNAPQSPQTVALSGTVVVAGVSLSPSSVSFGNQLVGVASTPVPITLTNTGQGALTVSGASVSDAANYTAKNNCTGVAAGGTCTIQITFNPAAPAAGAQCGSTTGAKNANLILTDNTASSPQTVVLSGTATDFCPAPPAVGGGSITVSPGMTATYQLDVTSVGGFSGAVAMACTGSVPGGTCMTSASTVNVTANGQTPFQVSVTTGTSAGSPNARQFRWPPWNWCLIAISLFAMFALANLKRRANLDSARARWISPALVLLVLFSVAMSACGGGTGSVQTANTYSLTVTATAGGATRTLGLTLIVQ
jgi:HYDIN/CFA65/VesB family protein/centrosomal CEP192-like protein/beta-propeller repeat-containing protein